ncbi:MAG: hypothetical protein HC853_02195, partial [Anaerolineae bacterium]|nr:hypothetical protein [Anaerolineae bacterium]
MKFFEKYLERSSLQYVLSSDVDEAECVHVQTTAVEAIDRMLQRHLPKTRKKEHRFDEEDLRDVITDLLCDAYLMFWRAALPTVRDADELPPSMFIAHQLATSVATWDGLFALRGRTMGSSSLSLQAAAELLKQLEIPIPPEALQAAAIARHQEKKADAAEHQAGEAS